MNTTKQLLADPEISCHADVAKALNGRLAHVKRLVMLEGVVRLAKQGQIGDLLKKLLVDPRLIAVLLLRMPEMIAMRLRRRLRRENLNRAQRSPGVGTVRASFTDLGGIKYGCAG